MYVPRGLASTLTEASCNGQATDPIFLKTVEP